MKVVTLEDLKKGRVKSNPRPLNKKAFEALRKRITKQMEGLPPSEVIIRRMRDARS